MCLAEKYARTIICRSVVKKSVTFLAKSGVFGANEQQTAATNRHFRTDACVQAITPTFITHGRNSKIMEFTEVPSLWLRLFFASRKGRLDTYWFQGCALFRYSRVNGVRVHAVCIVIPNKKAAAVLSLLLPVRLPVYPSAHLRFRLGLGVLPFLPFLAI